LALSTEFVEDTQWQQKIHENCDVNTDQHHRPLAISRITIWRLCLVTCDINLMDCRDERSHIF